MPRISRAALSIDWILVGSLLPLILGGLLTMYSFSGTETFFSRQIVWALISFAVFLALSFIDFRFMRKTPVVVAIYLTAVLGLILVLMIGSAVKGSKSWISFSHSQRSKIWKHQNQVSA